MNVDDNFLKDSSPELIDALLQGISSGDVWLNKIRYDDNGNRLRANVCLEVYLPHRGTCLLQHVNMGACGIDDLSAAFVEGMEQLCTLHPSTGVGDTGEYLSPAIDKQVGLGMLGLANFLANEGVSYEDFGKALEAYLDSDLRAWETKWFNTIAGQIVWKLDNAIEDAAAVARGYGMDRAFCIAPTASCSYRYLDKKGFTTTPEIAPPIARTVDRDSGTFGVESFDYGEVEIAEEVGEDNIFIFGNTVNQVKAIKEKGYNPYDFYETNKELRTILDWLDSDFFTPGSPYELSAIKHSLLDGGDPYLVLADYQSYSDAHNALDLAYKDKARWAKMAILNTALMGKFNSDRSIEDYVKNIWHLTPCVDTKATTKKKSS